MRLPPGARWDDIESRVTRDSATGEIIEDRHASTNPARAHAALQRLDRVRDIETVVTLLDKLEGAGEPQFFSSPGCASACGEDFEFVDLTVDSGTEEIELLEPGQRWADCESDDE